MAVFFLSFKGLCKRVGKKKKKKKKKKCLSMHEQREPFN